MLFPSLKRKTVFVISVVDSFALTDFYYKLNRESGFKSFPLKFEYHIVFYKTNHLKAFHIVLNKLFRVKLRLTSGYQPQRTIEVYDGPDDQTKLINQIRTQIILSTFPMLS